MYANAFYWLGILYFLQMPIYSKFHIEVHLRKRFCSAKTMKNKKTPCKFFYYILFVFILSDLAAINFWCSMNTKDVFSM